MDWSSVDTALGLVNHPVNRDRLKALLDFSGAVGYRAYTSSPYRILAEDILTGDR